MSLRVVLDEALWIIVNGDGTHSLVRPLATNHRTGDSLPGVVQGRITVLRAGTQLDLRLHVPDCAGCQQYDRLTPGGEEPVSIEHQHDLL